MSDDPQRHDLAGRLVPAATFVVGLALGAVLVGVGRSGDGAATDGSPTPSASSTQGAGSPTATAGDVLVTVPSACGDAARNLRTATSLIDQTVGSVRNFDPERLVQLLNELEALDSRTRPLVAQCQEVDVATATSSATSTNTATDGSTGTATP